jgi:hypothetical protein
VSDVERVAAAMRKADADLEVQPPDLTQTADHARRSLIRRLLLVGTLSAVGATLLLTGGLTPAAIKRSENKQHKTASEKKYDGNEKENKHNASDGGHHHQAHQSDDGKKRKNEKHEASVGPGAPIAVQLPDLIVSEISKTVLAVENISPADAGSFVVLVTIEAEGQEPTELKFPFEAGLAGGQKAVMKIELECESGLIGAEVDPETQVEETSEGNNVWTGTPPAECEPPEDKGKTKEEEEREKAKETTGTVDSATNAVGAATEP